MRISIQERSAQIRSRQRYNLILDCIGNHPLLACRHALTPKGICILVGGSAGQWIDPLPRLIKALVLSRFLSQKLIPFMAKPSKEDLAILAKLMASGKVTPVIGKRYRLSEVPDAMRYMDTLREKQ